tara:strand:+ start:914 stop:1147 length:234 start_codon:yes stop_codon:yes gene_type:complete
MTKLFQTKFLVLLIQLKLTFAILVTDDRKIYDPYGKYKGKITIEGKIYDPYGKYKGRITKEGKIYSPYGKYLGIIKK